MSVCSPTRAAIMTGKHAARLHMTIWREGSVERVERVAKAKTQLLPPTTVHDLPGEETTIAEALRPAGYVTLHVGKWHLGDAAHYPETQGFDVNIGGTHWGAPNTFLHPFSGARTFRDFRYVPGLGLGKPGDYLTDRLTDEALKLLDAVGKMLEYFEDGRVELFNLRNDVAESENLAEKQAEKAQGLRRRLAAWREEVGAQLPEPNPGCRTEVKRDGSHLKISLVKK